MRCTLLITLSIFSAVACSSQSKQPGVPLPVTSVTAQATPRSDVKPADLGKLRWLEGDWRGMDGDKPFFERYAIEDGKALIVTGYEDDMFSKAGDVTRYELRDGVIGNGTYAVSEIKEGWVSFVPVANARNSFTFERVSDNEWAATLNWPANADKPARQKVYRMVRIEQQKK